MRSLPLACARPLRADANATARRSSRTMAVVHQVRPAECGCPRAVPNPPRSSGALAPGCGIDRGHLPTEDRQAEAAADQRGLGHDIAVGDPPAHRAVLLDRKGLDLGLD